MSVITVDTSSLVAKTNADEKEMLDFYKENGKLHFRINSSSLDILQMCDRKALYSLERKLVAQSQSPAQIFGKAIHKALERFYKAPFERRQIPKNFSEKADLLAYGTGPEEDNEILHALQDFCDEAQPLAGLSSTDKRSIPNGIWILSNYFQSFIDDPFIAAEDDQGPIVERNFTYTFVDEPHLKIDIFGTIDAVLKDVKTGDVIPTDHKTSSVVGPDFYKKLKPNHQYTLYTIGVNEVLGLSTESFMVNCLEVKAKPKTARGQGPKFPRQITKRKKEDIEELREVLKTYCFRYAQNKEQNSWPLGSPNACAMYGGCQYHDICSSSSSLRENIIKYSFQERSQNAKSE